MPPSSTDDEAPTERGAPRSEAFQADLAALRRAFGTYWPSTIIIRRFIRMVLRRPVQSLSRTQLLLAGAVTVGLRLLLPIAVTTMVGAWTDAPFWRWFVIGLILGSSDVYTARSLQEASPQVGRFLSGPAAIEHDADLRHLVQFSQRWWRPRVMAPASVVVALAVLVACGVVAPDEFRAVHVGSLAMLTVLLYEFGEAVIGSILAIATIRREAHFPHRLSWLSPVDSPPVRGMLRAWGSATMALGEGTALYFVMAVVLIEPDSISLVLAPVAGFALISVVVTIAMLLGMRSGVQAIVLHTRDATLQRLQHRIDTYEPRLEDLSPDEWRRLQGLIATYAAVREAPTSPTGGQTVGKALSALAIPALGFLLAVLAEVYAERLFDQFLP